MKKYTEEQELLEQDIRDFEETFKNAQEEMEESVKWLSKTEKNLEQARKALSDFKNK